MDTGIPRHLQSFTICHIIVLDRDFILGGIRMIAQMVTVLRYFGCNCEWELQPIFA